jgi:hypothetical protein
MNSRRTILGFWEPAAFPANANLTLGFVPA